MGTRASVLFVERGVLYLEVPLYVRSALAPFFFSCSLVNTAEVVGHRETPSHHSALDSAPLYHTHHHHHQHTMALAFAPQHSPQHQPGGGALHGHAPQYHGNQMQGSAPNMQDWLKAWKSWAATRKRGKMAQFIVQKLEENVSERGRKGGREGREGGREGGKGGREGGRGV